MHRRKEVGCGGMTGGVEEPDPRREKGEARRKERDEEEAKQGEGPDEGRKERRNNDQGKGRRA